MIKYLVYIIIILFNISCNNIDLEVFNAGISNNTSEDLLNRFEKDVIDKQPNYAIIMVGTNDMVNSTKMKTYSDYQNNVEKIVQELKLKKIKVLLCSPPPIDSVYLF